MATRKNKQDQASKKEPPPAPRRGPAGRAPERKAPPPKPTGRRGGARVKYEDRGDEPDFGGEIDQILTR